MSDEDKAPAPLVGFTQGQELWGHALPYCQGAEVIVPDTFWTRDRVALLVEALHYAAMMMRHGASSPQQREHNRQAWLKVRNLDPNKQIDRSKLEPMETDDWQHACALAGVLPSDVTPRQRKAVSLTAAMRSPREILTRAHARGGRHWAISQLTAEAKASDRPQAPEPTPETQYRGAHSADEDLFE